MTEIEKKALALVNEVRASHGLTPCPLVFVTGDLCFIALCRAIEQHEAYRQEVSDELPSPALGGKQTLLQKRMCGVSTSIWGRQLPLTTPCLPPPSPPALRRSARAKERAKRKDTTHD